MFFGSAYWKHQAREALKNNWLTGLLIALVVNLPSLLVQGIAAATGNDLINRITEILYGSISEGGTGLDPERMTAGLAELRGATGVWVMQGLNVAAWLLTPCLTIGMIHWLLTRLRKQEAGDVGAVFSRIGLFLKGIGLRLYTAWRVFLWILPGLALIAAAWLPLWLSDSSSRISVLSAANTSMRLQSVAMIVTFVLGIMAALKYVLGDMVLADHPEKGPVRAAKESKNLTKGKRGPLVSLYISFLLWYLLEMAAVSLTMDLFGSIPGLMVEMLCSLAISVYMHASVSAFYLTCVKAEEGGRTEATGEEEENNG